MSEHPWDDKDVFSRPIKIHCCKDRTLTYRNKLQPIFNKVALPVFSVNSVDEARQLIALVSNRQYDEHPLNPGDTWWKIDMGPNIHLFDDPVTQLPEVTKKLAAAYELMLSHKADQSRLAG